MKNTCLKILAIIAVLGTSQALFAGDVSHICLENWDDFDGGPPQRLEGYIGYGEDYCYRVEMLVSYGVDGEFCLDLDSYGSITSGLQGSSYYTGRDCYSTGYIDPTKQWSNTCAFLPGVKFEARTQSVKAKFCGEDD